MKYVIEESHICGFMVYAVSSYAYTCVKTFKTRKGAENWIRKHS